LVEPKQEVQLGSHVFTTTIRFITPQLATDVGWSEVDVNVTKAVEAI